MSIIPWAGTGDLLTGDPGAGVPAQFQPISCYETAVFSGYVTGHLFAPFDMNLDVLNDDEVVTGVATALPSMEVSLDWQNSIKPEITCTGAAAQVRTQAGPPLGFAPPHETNNGTVVSYSYSMNSTLTILVIDGGPDLPFQYIFSKI